MGIKTDKTLMILGFISVTFIIATASLIQLSNTCLLNYEQAVQKKILEITKDNSYSIFFQNQHTRYDLYKIGTSMGFEMLPSTEDYNYGNQYPEVVDSENKWMNGEISLQDHLLEMTQFFSKKSNEYRSSHNTKIDELEELQKNTPSLYGFNCNKINNYSYTIQFIAVIVSAIIYLMLFKSIGKSYLTRVERENQRLETEIIKLKKK